MKRPRRKRAKCYSDELTHRVDAQIPGLIMEAMNRLGWNALGIYEIVNKEIRKEKCERGDSRRLRGLPATWRARAEDCRQSHGADCYCAGTYERVACELDAILGGPNDAEGGFDAKR